MKSGGGFLDLAWDKKYEVGHVRIDSEHKTFFDIIKEIESDYRKGSDLARVLRSVSELKLYTEFHFTSEENLMEDMHYPDLRAHREIHQQILAEMNAFITDIRGGIGHVDELVTFLFHWFCTHTVTEDSKFSRYVANRTD